MDRRPVGGHQSGLDQEEQKPGARERTVCRHEPRRRRDAPRLVNQRREEAGHVQENHEHGRADVEPALPVVVAHLGSHGRCREGRCFRHVCLSRL